MEEIVEKFIKAKPKNQIFKINSSVEPLLDFKSYEVIVNKILAFIKAGDAYQINISNKYHAQCEGDSWTGYKKLREINRSPFMAYLHYENLIFYVDRLSDLFTQVWVVLNQGQLKALSQETQII